MANYIVRIELHVEENNKPNYNKLHSAMRDTGFSQSTTVRTPNGVAVRRLPDGEYYIDSNATIERIAEAARMVADTVNKPTLRLKNKIHVTHAADQYGINL